MHRLLRNASMMAGLLALACATDGGNDPMEPAGSISINLGASTITLTAGETRTAAVTVVRGAGFAGTVTLSIEGASTGITASLNPTSLSGNASSSVLTVTAAPAAGAGTHNLTVRATAQGVTSSTASVTAQIIAAEQLGISTPGSQQLPVGQPFMLDIETIGPGTHTFASVGQPLPGGLTLDPATGIISGMPTTGALLAGSPAGQWGGIIIEVSNGTTTARTNAFVLNIVGTQLPAPYAYMPFDGTSLNDFFGRNGTAVGTVTAGVAGAIGNGVTVSGTDSRIRYATSLASQLNGKSALTIATTLRTTSTGTMFFGLADESLGWNRAYAEFTNGRIFFGGRSQRRQNEPYRSSGGSAVVNDGQFHTFVGVMELSADRVTLFIDGVLDRSDIVPFNQNTFEVMTPANENVIGHLSINADTPVAPTVTHDEFALWDVALNANQAATIRWLILRGMTLRQWIGF